MKILWNIHLYPPKHNCGSEWMAHHINKFLLSKGHEIKVCHQDGSKYGIKDIYQFDGVDVFPPYNTEGMFRWADVILTHLDYSGKTIQMATQLGKPVIFFHHNSHHSFYQHRIEQGKVGVVYNSVWQSKEAGFNNKSCVLHPPVDWKYYDVMTGDPYDNEYITLIGLSMNKGGEVLYKIAEAMPERKFLGVKGSYDPQIMDPNVKNVEVLENTPNILEIYKKTRILLMPSTYESWGRTATEAMCNGIPVIANPTPGLRENLDYAGLFCDLTSLEPWLKAIKKLDSQKQYSHYSKLAEKRSRELSPEPELENFNSFLINFVKG